MKNLKIGLLGMSFLTAVSLASPQAAQAGFFMSAQGDYLASIPISYSGASNVLFGNGFGGGIELGPTFGKGFELGIGAKYLNRGFSILGSITASTLRFPVELRFWIAKFLAIGAGGYFDYILSTNATIGGQTINNIGAGAATSLDFAIPVGGGQWSIVFGTKFYIPIMNMSRVAGTSLMMLDINGYLGVRWGNTKS